MHNQNRNTIVLFFGFIVGMLLITPDVSGQSKKWRTYTSGIVELERRKNIFNEYYNALYFHGSLIQYRKAGPVHLGLEAHTDGVFPLDGVGILGDLWVGPSIQYNHRLNDDYDVFVRGSLLKHIALSDNYTFIQRWRVPAGSLTPTITQSDMTYLAIGAEKKVDKSFSLFVITGYRWLDLSRLVPPASESYKTQGLFMQVGISF